MVNILGIGGFSHDSAACLLQDGKIQCAAMEERFTRKKHQGGIPYRAVQWCLDKAGLTLDDLDHVGFYMDWKKRMGRRLLYRAASLLHHPRYSLAYILYEFAHNGDYLYGAYRLKGKKARIHFLDHHRMHGAASFFASPYEDAALLSLDYIGEWSSTWYGMGSGNRTVPLREIHYPQSLGVFYSALTDYLGFERANDEYKVMGLASYGDPERYLPVFRRMISTPLEGEYRIDLDYFQYQYVPGSRRGYVSRRFIEELGQPRRQGEPIEQRHQDIAAAGQKVLEETVLHLTRYLYEISGRQSRLCIGGGVGLNCSMNGMLLAQSPFDEIYVQPAAGDDGIALGTAWHIYHEILGKPRNRETLPGSQTDFGRVNETVSNESPAGLNHALLGPSYENEAIEEILKVAKVKYHRMEDVCKTTAEWIAKGAIVGWFQGAMEFGPRALGGRSILADSTREDMKDILNKWVKHREDFRPFAPSVCEENFHEYFDHPRCSTGGKSPFMLFVFPVREEMRSRIPAVTHIDGTARVQTVSAQTQPLYYRLLREFEKIKGVPVVLNTSFNVRGEPIVCSPQDALRCFFTTGIDVLVMGEYLIVK